MGNDKKFSPEQMYETLTKVLGATEEPHCGAEPEVQTQVQILPDKSVSPGSFLPHPLLPGAYKAHPQTIAAVRKDIFMAGNEFVDLEEIIKCDGCKESIDKQFWVFCPFCGAKYKE